MDFGTRLKQLREEHQLYQKELADRLGISRDAVSTYEGNRRFPGPEMLEKIADYFHVSIDYLLGRSDDRTESILKRYNIPADLAPEIARLFASLPEDARNALVYAQRNLGPEDWRTVGVLLKTLVEELGQKTGNKPK